MRGWAVEMRRRAGVTGDDRMPYDGLCLLQRLVDRDAGVGEQLAVEQGA
ncbi:MAG: hypothetical protein IPG88_18335 [Gemmatimonadetes bacterium]|nr:hypothetical protein [Gemmatimonadota bacterium]